VCSRSEGPGHKAIETQVKGKPSGPTPSGSVRFGSVGIFRLFQSENGRRCHIQLDLQICSVNALILCHSATRLLVTHRLRLVLFSFFRFLFFRNRKLVSVFGSFISIFKIYVKYYQYIYHIMTNKFQNKASHNIYILKLDGISG
jgi:hypothetical protein